MPSATSRTRPGRCRRSRRCGVRAISIEPTARHDAERISSRHAEQKNASGRCRRLGRCLLAARAGAVPGRDLGRRRDAAADRDPEASATRTAPASRSPPSCAPTSSAAACSAPIDASATLDETSQPVMSEWRSRAADALVAGSVTRLADGRFDVRFKLWDVVKGTELGGQSNAGRRRRPAARGAPHRRLHLREADRREGRVLDPHRLRHQGRQPLHAARRRCRRRGRPGGAEQRRADHLAGLVARRQASWPTSRSRARRRSSTRRTC